ncbi:tetraspanin-6-like [Vespula pensylvanica]|uniref:tetraspanin-6-like n=1 Tax=Vespula pensylvanica TaxID=30213 RepID=UPI001CB9F172|nr:tetraspanin-6-like [Vespula pensylvanica]
MWLNDEILLLLSRKKYPWIGTVLLSVYFTITFAIVLVGIALLLLCFGIKLRTLWDLILLEPYLTTDNTILLSISIMIMASAILGIISAFTYSQRGLLTSLLLIFVIFSITNIYTIGFREKNYISELDLYLLLSKIMRQNKFTISFHLMQKSLSCCGIRYYEEWVDRYGIIPGSCCQNSTLYCNKDDPSLFKDGCFDIITKILNKTYQNSIEIIITLNVFFIIILFSGYFNYYILQKMKRNKTTFITLPRILVPNDSKMKVYNKNCQQTPSTLDNNTVQAGNNTVQAGDNTVQNNSPVVYNPTPPVPPPINENIEPLYPYLTMPEPSIRRY